MAGRQLGGAIRLSMSSYCASTVADVREGGALWHGFEIDSELAGSGNADSLGCFAFYQMTGRGSFCEVNSIAAARSWDAAWSGNTGPGNGRLSDCGLSHIATDINVGDASRLVRSLVARIRKIRQIRYERT